MTTTKERRAASITQFDVACQDLPDLSISIDPVTPDMALGWLSEDNNHNRNLRPGKVDSYARDMAAGMWQFNGDPLRFAADGTILDGQHRLSALVRADVTLPFLIIRGLPMATQETMDIGAARRMSDALHLRGEPNAALLASIARRVVLYDTGRRSESGNLPPTHAEMTAHIEAHPEIRRAVEVAMQSRRMGLDAAPSVVGAAYSICARLSPQDAEKFYVEQLIDGVGLAKDDPAKALQRRLATDAATGRPMHPDDVLRYAFAAWNHFRGGRRITKLQAPHGGWSPKTFPVPK